MNPETLKSVIGLALGAAIVLTIQLTIGNPFIWLEDKIREWRDRP